MRYTERVRSEPCGCRYDAPTGFVLAVCGGASRTGQVADVDDEPDEQAA